MAYKIVIASTKGGVGKTTSAVTLAAGLANFEPTLVCDFDDQGQIALHFGKRPKSGVYMWLIDRKPIADCIDRIGDNLSILPGDLSTKIVSHKFHTPRDLKTLRGKVMDLEAGYIIFDTKAGGILQEAVLPLADHVIIPFRLETPSEAALYTTLKIVKEVAPSARVTCLPCDYDARSREHRGNYERLVRDLPPEYGVDGECAIKHRFAVAEAVAVGQTIWDYKSDHILPVRAAYSLLVSRILSASHHLAYLTAGNQS